MSYIVRVNKNTTSDVYYALVHAVEWVRKEYDIHDGDDIKRVLKSELNITISTPGLDVDFDSDGNFVLFMLRWC